MIGAGSNYEMFIITTNKLETDSSGQSVCAHSWCFLFRLTSEQPHETRQQLARRYDDEGAQNSFEYFRPLREPFNPINDTPVQSMVSLSASMAAGMFPMPCSWQPRPRAVMKYYVDDFLGCEKLSNARPPLRPFPQPRSGEVCKPEPVRNSSQQGIGMTVNPSKIQMICITSARNSVVESFINVHYNQELNDREQLKILGFIFDSRPSIDAHIVSLVSKFSCCIWLLQNLKRAEVPLDDLTKLYKILIVYTSDRLCLGLLPYSMLIDWQEGRLKLQQYKNSPSRSYSGTNWATYNELLEKSGCETLCDRRLPLIDKLLSKTVQCEIFQHRWFQEKEPVHIDLRCER